MRESGINIAALADIYDQRPHEDISEVCKRILRAVTESLFSQIPIVIEWVTGSQPYDTFEAMAADIRENGRMKVLSGYVDSPVFGVTYAKFRAVHDYYDHYLADVGFGTVNEAKAFGVAATRFPSECWPALYNELVLANAYYDYNGKRHAQDKYIVQ